MNINFEYKDVAASKRLEGMASDKLHKLEEKYDFIVGCDVYLKTENTSSPETGMICDIRLNVPGTTLFASGNTGAFESAIAESVGDVKKQLQKRKEKMQTH
jgi:putative sigma-54 modulation protein